jgi:CelD/BcsL family acetyltransferase involved in cellulose biosynthesis
MSFEAELRSDLWRRRVVRLANPRLGWRGPSRSAPPAPSRVSTRIATRVDSELAARWEDLARRVGAAPYLRPGWIAAWWRAFGSGRLEIRTLERDGRLIALVPLARRRGVVRSLTNPHTPDFGLLAEDRPAAFTLARSLFQAGAPRRMSIASLDPSTFELDAYQRAAAEVGYRTCVRSYERSPYLLLDGDWESYESSLRGSFIAGLRRSRRQLERLGPHSVEIADGRERLDSHLEEAFAVESSGWKGARGTAIRANPQTREFYTELARWAAERDLLRLFFLRLRGRAIAMYFALAQDGVLFLLKGGYDPDSSRVSPGKLLLHRLVEHAFRSGVRRIEFHGAAEPYKLRFSETVHERVMLDAFARSPTGRLDWALWRYGRPVAKRMLGSADEVSDQG